MAANLRETKVDLLSTKNLDFHQRQIKNAAPAVEDYDYVVLKQLNDAINTINKSISSSSSVKTTTPTPTSSTSSSTPTTTTINNITEIVNSTTTIPLCIGFVILDGSTGTNVGPELLAPHSGTLNKCKIRVKAADASTDLTLSINKNGTSIFSTTVAHGTTGTVNPTFSTAVVTSQDDVFTIDISSGTSSWKFTIQLES
jgi:hypothetical protein